MEEAQMMEEKQMKGKETEPQGHQDSQTGIAQAASRVPVFKDLASTESAKWNMADLKAYLTGSQS